MGKSAKQAVQWGRESVAGVISADPDDIYFTGGATESCNLCIFGTAPGHKRHFVTTAIEHKAVLNPMDCLRAHGHDVTFVQPMEQSAGSSIVDDSVASSMSQIGVKAAVSVHPAGHSPAFAK